MADNHTLPQGRYLHSAAVWQGTLYVMGGAGSGGLASEVYAADVQPDGSLGTWSTLTPLPQAVYTHAAVQEDGTLYVLGGWITDGTVLVSDVYMSRIMPNHTLEGWQVTTPLPEPVVHSIAVVAGGRVHAFGGWTGSAATTAHYSAPILSDKTLGDWEPAPALPVPLYDHAAAVAGGAFYISGGTSDGSNTLSQVYAYTLDLGGPVIAKTITSGPRVVDSALLVDLAGLATGSNDDGAIDIGRTDSQFYEFLLKISNNGDDNQFDGVIVSDSIPDTYDLDPLCGDDPVAATTSCDAVGGGTFVDRDDDTRADGIINDTPTKCTVSTSSSDSSIKKGGAGKEPEFVTIVIAAGFNSGDSCRVRVFVKTDENPSKKSSLFEPAKCRELDTGIFDTIPLNEGVKLFDPDTGDRLLGPVGSLQLTPNNCP